MKSLLFIAKRSYWLHILLFLGIGITGAHAQIIVNPGDNYNSMINNASPGDVFIFNPGDYENLKIQNVNGTAADPIILKSKRGRGSVNFRGQYNVDELWWSGNVRGGDIRNCSYMVFKNLRFSRGSEGVHVFESDHLIFLNCEITNTGQVGIKFSKKTARNNTSTDYTHHIDWIGGRVWNTGNSENGPYGEAFYIGQAQQNYDLTHDIWIEGVEIWDTNGGEAFDVKPEVKNITIRKCKIHDIEIYAIQNLPGFENEVNSGAIQVIASADPNVPNNLTPGHHELWIEKNKIKRVRAKAENTNDLRGNGISIIGRPGVYIKNTKIRDVEHDGIYGFDYVGPIPGFTTLIDKKTIKKIKKVGSGRSKVNISDGNYVLNADIGKNPMSRQTWLKDGIGDSTVTYNDDIISISAPVTVAQGSTATISVNYSASENRDVRVVFQLDSVPYTNYSSTRIDAVAGSSEYADIEVSIPPETPIANDAYQFQVYITTDGGGWSERFDNISQRDVDCILGGGRQVDVDSQHISIAKGTPLEIYPNPATGIITISASDSFSYNVMDFSGRTVLSGRSTSNVKTLDMSGFKRGVYLVSCSDGVMKTSRKIVLR